jgi:anti-sigma regulatory factor (Ser/Thr protein kinase)
LAKTVASAPADRRPVMGRVDRVGRLVAADPELAALQMEAGSTIGGTLALPQVAAVARLARKLGIPVARPAVAAGSDHDIDLWVRAVPQGDEVSLALEGWTVRPAASPRLAALLGGEEASGSQPEAGEWAADQELKLLSISPGLAERLGSTAEALLGQPLTRIFRLEEDESGEMPLITALAARHGFSGQPARPRAGEPVALLLSGEVMFSADGSFDGFSGRALAADAEQAAAPSAGAARHLLSVIRSMGEQPAGEQHSIDLADLAKEAVVLVEAPAEARGVTITLEASRRLRASGEERAVIQILVNLIGNAVRHSPPGGTVTLRFSRGSGTVCVVVVDDGPGIAPADQQRIFERFERAGADSGGTGLGLAISRRLARSMGGDITVESTPPHGARFTLALAAA